MADLKTELRAATLVDADVSGRTVSGYAAVFEQPWNERLTEQLGYVEEIARGAFRKALGRGNNIPLLWQHERRDMLATTKGNTLRLKEDGNGLHFEAELPENPLGDYVLSMVERGDVRGMSYGMLSRPEDSRVEKRGDVFHRIIKDMQGIHDVSLTYEPSYEAATVELRSMGFAALPLQEIVGGNEAQPDEAVTEKASIAMLENRERLARVRISIAEG